MEWGWWGHKHQEGEHRAALVSKESLQFHSFGSQRLNKRQLWREKWRGSGGGEGGDRGSPVALEVSD